MSIFNVLINFVLPATLTWQQRFHISCSEISFLAISHFISIMLPCMNEKNMSSFYFISSSIDLVLLLKSQEGVDWNVNWRITKSPHSFCVCLIYLMSTIPATKWLWWADSLASELWGISELWILKNCTMCKLTCEEHATVASRMRTAAHQSKVFPHLQMTWLI